MNKNSLIIDVNMNTHINVDRMGLYFANMFTLLEAHYFRKLYKVTKKIQINLRKLDDHLELFYMRNRSNPEKKKQVLFPPRCAMLQCSHYIQSSKDYLYQMQCINRVTEDVPIVDGEEWLSSDYSSELERFRSIISTRNSFAIKYFGIFYRISFWKLIKYNVHYFLWKDVNEYYRNMEK